MVPIGEYDQLHPVLGVRGSGKSTWLLELAARQQNKYGCILLCHSPGGLLPIDRSPIPVVSVPDMKGVERAMRRQPDHLIMLTRDEPETLRDYAIDVSASIKKDAMRRHGVRVKRGTDVAVPPGVQATPILLLLDEGTSTRTRRGSGKITAEWEEFLARMRHWHIGLVYGNQRPSSMAYAFAELSTHIHAFRYEHRWGLDALRAAGMPPDMVKKVPTLQKFQRVSYSRWGEKEFL